MRAWLPYKHQACTEAYVLVGQSSKCFEKVESDYHLPKMGLFSLGYPKLLQFYFFYNLIVAILLAWLTS